ncbi:hypothetical protein [Nocardia sp. NPDC056000]|uniref:hypothetical protein n=1 Tax=Nocardia sp. NPDC056000 TaxID=3345674 RepID=UPI0035DB3CC7
MPLHIVIGAGPVGTATALQLATGGARVRLLTRHGSGPEHPGTAWGRAWHVPSAPPVSVRALADLLAAVAGVAPARVMRMPAALLWSAGLFVPAAREMRELRYQFDRPFIMDSASATKHFDLEGTPLEESMRRTVDAFRGDTAQRGMEPRR